MRGEIHITVENTDPNIVRTLAKNSTAKVNVITLSSDERQIMITENINYYNEVDIFKRAIHLTEKFQSLGIIRIKIEDDDIKEPAQYYEVHLKLNSASDINRILDKEKYSGMKSSWVEPARRFYLTFRSPNKQEVLDLYRSARSEFDHLEAKFESVLMDTNPALDAQWMIHNGRFHTLGKRIIGPQNIDNKLWECFDGALPFSDHNPPVEVHSDSENWHVIGSPESIEFHYGVNTYSFPGENFTVDEARNICAALGQSIVDSGLNTTIARFNLTHAAYTG